MATNTLISPYIFSWGHNNNKKYKTNNLKNAIDAGLKSITLGFLTCDKYDEILQWENDIIENHSKINVILSIGGAIGEFPSKSLSYEEEANRLYNLLTRLRIKMIDLDIEGESLENEGIVKNWINVVKLLQSKFENNIWISLTLPIEFNGKLNKYAVNAFNLFIKSKIGINLVNLMLMDFYTPLDSNFKNWGDKHIQILYQFYNQFDKMRIKLNLPQCDNLWNKIGICPMIGENDDKTKFTLQDWEKLLKFSQSKGIGLVTFWAINRDQKSHLLSYPNINDCSKCQSKDLSYTAKVLEIFNN